MIIEEEDIPIYKRPRVQAWAGAASSLDSLPSPFLGSLERAEMLEDAHCLEKKADILYEEIKVLRKEAVLYKKIKVLRKEAELLREQAYQKRVQCAPICSLPSETLSRILLQATPDSFAYNAVKISGAHPLSPISRAWRDIMKTTPEFYSRINIDIHYPIQDSVSRNVERWLKPWLANARSTGLNINFHLHGAVPTDQTFYSSRPLHAIWMLLLSLVGNWQEFSCSGASYFTQQFWKKGSSAQRLEIVSLDSLHHTSVKALVFEPFSCHLNLPKLQSLLLSGHFPADFIIHQFPSVRNLRTLTLPNIASFPKGGLGGISDSFPFITKLQLEDFCPRSDEVFQWSVKLPNAQLAGFKHLEHFEVSKSLMGRGTLALPALHGCHTLKTLRLQYTAFHLADNYVQLPSVERLELELGKLAPDPKILKRIWAILPSLILLKVSPAATNSPDESCNAGFLLLNLWILAETNETPPPPKLEKFVLERTVIPICDIICFLADRTFDATPAALKYLEVDGAYYYEPDCHRNTCYLKWKPECLVTISNCPRTKGMVDVGLEVLIDLVKSSKLILDNPDEGDELESECDPGCDCDCGDNECSCCEHQWVDSEY